MSISYSYNRVLLLSRLNEILDECADPIKQLELKASIEVCEQKVNDAFISRILYHLKDDVLLAEDIVTNVIFNLRSCIDFDFATIDYDKVEDPAQLVSRLKHSFRPTFFNPYYYNHEVRATHYAHF